MKFIGIQAEARGFADNELTDGGFSLRYRELAGYFEQFAETFDKWAVEASDCLVLEAGNSLPAALTLAYLLERGQHFLLLPENGLETADAPVFCRYLLKIVPTPQEGQAVPPPADFLTLVENPTREPGAGLPGPPAPKLFMRTSGSTGEPKMVMFTQARLHGNCLNCTRRFSLSTDDRVAIPAPIYHMYGLGAALLPSLMAGAGVDLQKSANLLKFIQREGIFKPNVAFMTPSFANTLVKARKSPRPYRLTVTAGDRFRENQFEQYQNMFGPLVQLYGSTELGAIAAGEPGQSLAIRRRHAGLPMPDVRLKITQPSEEGEGALWCKREYGFEGYVDRRGEVLPDGRDARGWFPTRDTARLSPEGYLEVLGRGDHSVNRDGLLVFFADLEKTIECLEQVEAVAVVAGGEGVRGKRLIAYCVAAKGSDLSAEAVRGHCFETLPRRAVPDEVRLLESLPLLPNGKVDRVSLAARQ